MVQARILKSTGKSAAEGRRTQIRDERGQERLSARAAGSARPRRASSSRDRRSLRSVVEDEGHQQVDLVLDDPAVPDVDALLLDPCAGHVAEGLGGAGDALVDGVVETFGGRRADLGDSGNGHADLLSGAWSTRSLAHRAPGMKTRHSKLLSSSEDPID